LENSVIIKMDENKNQNNNEGFCNAFMVENHLYSL
jgi:hypothetical protein